MVAIERDYVRFYPSQNLVNGASLGGAPATIDVNDIDANVIMTDANALFDLITGVDSQGGHTDYRVVYVRNTTQPAPVDEIDSTAVDVRVYLTAGSGTSYDANNNLVLNPDGTADGTSFSVALPAPTAAGVPPAGNPNQLDDERTDKTADHGPWVSNCTESITRALKGWDGSSNTASNASYTRKYDLLAHDGTNTGTGANGQFMPIYLRRIYDGDPNRAAAANITVNLVAAFDEQANEN